MKYLLHALASACLAALLLASAAPAAAPPPVVVMDTTKGMIMIMLDPENAPVSTANFLNYVEKGFYNGLVFHRVVKEGIFVVQGGGLDEAMQPRDGGMPPIKNEARNGLSNSRGTISMARTAEPDSATTQFFLNFKDNTALNRKSDKPGEEGYAVFGKVVRGMNVVDEIAKIKTVNKGRYQDVPAEPVVIKKAYIYKEQ